MRRVARLEALAYFEPRMKTIAVLGTLDTKGEEHAYVAEIIRSRGHRTLLIDVGCLTPATKVATETRMRSLWGSKARAGQDS